MIYYFTNILLFFFSVINQSKINKVTLKLLAISIFIYFIFFGGLRFEVGADWKAYENLFLGISDWKYLFDSREELLYMVSNYLIKNIFNDYSFFILIFFSISFYLKYSFIRRYSPDIFLSLSIYLYTIFLIFDVNGLRQGMALALTMVSVKFILNRNIYKFLIIILSASLFHISALIFAPFYFFSRISKSNRTVFFLFLLTFIFSIQLRLFLKNSDLFQTLIALDGLKHYSVYTLGNEYKLDIPIFSVPVLQRIIIFLLFLIRYDKIKVDEQIKLLFRNGYFFAIIIFLILSFSSEFGTRLSVYYKAMDIVIIPLIVYSFSNKHKKLTFLSLFFLFSTYGMYRLLEIPDGYLLPYNNLILLVFDQLII